MSRRNSRRRRFSSYSTLEPRQMLASIGFQNGEVLVLGNPTDDRIELIGSADFQSFTIRINNDANLTETFQYSEVTELSVFAGDGNDRVTNSLLIDTLISGGDGNDIIQGGFRNDVLSGGNGTDTVLGRHGDDLIRGQEGSDSLFGGPGADQLFGLAGNDRLIGGTGDDLLRGDAGNDQLNGEDGADELIGGEGADQLFGESGDDEIFGGNGNDILVGGLGNDLVVGNSGDDLLNGNEGNDRIVAGLGDDTVNGGLGNDVILGVAGINTLNGNGGEDQINGGTGDDEIDGGSEDDLLSGGDGEDRIRGREGEDRLFGGAGNDLLLGGDDDDFLAGQDGDDRLFGDSGENILFGNDGEDRFFTPRNNDRLDGGAGVDQVINSFTDEFSYRLDPISTSNSFRLTDLRNPSAPLWSGQVTLTRVEQFVGSEGSDSPIPTASLLLNPIVERIVVQPIVVSDDDGSNTANSFGTAEQEAEIKRRVNRIYNQAGVEVEFLPTRQFNSTFANGVGEGTRDVFEFFEIIERGDDAGIGSSNPQVVDYYFVSRVPGMTTPIGSGGRAFLGQSGATQAVGAFALFASTERVANVLAHEIGHNLGLEHTDGIDTLLTPGIPNGSLTADQIQQVIASDISRPV